MPSSAAFPQLNFQALHGRLWGLFRGLGSAGDAWAGGDGFQGVLEGVTNSITATASGTQATGVQLTAAINRVSVCATNGDSVVLPKAVQGMSVLVINDGAATCQVFGFAATADTIDAVATATGVTVTNARRTLFKALNTALPASGTQVAVPGLWISMGVAKST